MPKAYHTSSRFTLHFSLKNKVAPENQGRQKQTRYHLVSHCGAMPLWRCYGRAREWLPIDIPAPGPCSAPLVYPFPAAGALCKTICAYSSHLCLLWDCTAYYSHKPPDLSTIICPFGANRPGRHPKMPRPGGVRTKRSRFPGRVPPLLLYLFMVSCGHGRQFLSDPIITPPPGSAVLCSFAHTTHTP